MTAFFLYVLGYIKEAQENQCINVSAILHHPAGFGLETFVKVIISRLFHFSVFQLRANVCVRMSTQMGSNMSSAQKV